jgi:hypothetical protein
VKRIKVKAFAGKELIRFNGMKRNLGVAAKLFNGKDLIRTGRPTLQIPKKC